MADKKLVLSPEQTDQAIIYKAQNGLRMTAEEQRRYAEIVARNPKYKTAALQSGKKAEQAQTYEQQRAASATPYTKEQAQAINAGKTAGRQAAQANEQRVASVENAKAVKSTPEPSTDSKPAPAQSITTRQFTPASVSKFDKYLADFRMYADQYNKIKENRGKFPEADRQLQYLENAMAAIRKKAQDEGVYEFAKKTNRYNEFAILIGHDISGDTFRLADMFTTRGRQVYKINKYYDSADAHKAAQAYLNALVATAQASDKYNKTFTTSGYPEDYDFSADNSPFGTKLRKEYDSVITAKENFDIATTAVKNKLASTDEDWQKVFLLDFYEGCRKGINLSPSDRQYVDNVIAYLGMNPQDTPDKTINNTELSDLFAQARKEGDF